MDQIIFVSMHTIAMQLARLLERTKRMYAHDCTYGCMMHACVHHVLCMPGKLRLQGLKLDVREIWKPIQPLAKQSPFHLPAPHGCVGCVVYFVHLLAKEAKTSGTACCFRRRGLWPFASGWQHDFDVRWSKEGQSMPVHDFPLIFLSAVHHCGTCLLQQPARMTSLKMLERSLQQPWRRRCSGLP